MLQEIGRVGRDGNLSCALILYNAYMYHQRQLDANVKQFIKPTECRRQILMSNFLRQCDMETLQDRMWQTYMLRLLYKEMSV